MSDYVADVIAGFSPITDVPGNWDNFIDYFEARNEGAITTKPSRKFDEYISEDPENRSPRTIGRSFRRRSFLSYGRASY